MVLGRAMRSKCSYKICIVCLRGVDSVDRYAALQMAVGMKRLLERVQSRKKKVLGYLSHKIVMFDLYEPLCDRLFAPDPSQKNPVARPFRITPLLTEYVFRFNHDCYRFIFYLVYFLFIIFLVPLLRFVDPLLAKLAPILPPMSANRLVSSQTPCLTNCCIFVCVSLFRKVCHGHIESRVCCCVGGIRQEHIQRRGTQVLGQDRHHLW